MHVLPGMTKSGNYTIRQLHVDEMEALIPLYKNSFGVDVSLDFLNWKYKENPDGLCIGFVAETESKEIVAFYGVLPRKYMIADKITLIYQSCDLMTHSKHRRKGLFIHLVQHCSVYLKSQDSLNVIAFTGDFSTPGFMKLGWSYIDKGYQLFFPRLFFKLPLFRRSGFEVKEIKNPDQVKELLLKSNSHTVNHSIKDVESLSWRLKNPDHQYQLYGLFDTAKRLKGYFCYYLYKERIYLYDFYFEETKGLRTMMQFFKDCLKENDRLTGIQSFGSKNSYIYKTLIHNGFLKSPFRKNGLNLYLPFLLQTTEERLGQMKDARLWNLTPFDHDNL